MKKLIIPAIVLIAGAASAFTTHSTKTLADEPYRIDVPGVECAPVTETCTTVISSTICTHSLSGATLYAMNDLGTACDVDLFKP